MGTFLLSGKMRTLISPSSYTPGPTPRNCHSAAKAFSPLLTFADMCALTLNAGWKSRKFRGQTGTGTFGNWVRPKVPVPPVHKTLKTTYDVLRVNGSRSPPMSSRIQTYEGYTASGSKFTHGFGVALSFVVGEPGFALRGAGQCRICGFPRRNHPEAGRARPEQLAAQNHVICGINNQLPVAASAVGTG